MRALAGAQVGCSDGCWVSGSEDATRDDAGRREILDVSGRSWSSSGARWCEDVKGARQIGPRDPLSRVLGCLDYNLSFGLGRLAVTTF